MERIQDLVYTHVQGGQFRWVTVSTLMLALGTILHLVSPSVAGVTPNWTIATYLSLIHIYNVAVSRSVRAAVGSSMMTTFASNIKIRRISVICW